MSTDVRSTCPIGLLVGSTLRFTEATVTLTSGADGPRCHIAFDDEELGEGAELELIAGAGGASGHFRAGGVVAPLFDGVDLVERTFPVGDEAYSCVGLQGDFSFPHDGPFRRLRSVFAGVQDANVIEALAEMWGADEAGNVRHLPWTLESLTRFAAAYARTLPGVRDVSIAEPGQLSLEFADGRLQASLHNLYAMARLEPDSVTERIADFFAMTRPDLGPSHAGNILFRVMRAPAPVKLQVEVEGGVREVTLASRGVGPDLSAVFVQDSPHNIAYLQADEVEGLAPDADALMRLASENLMRTLPRVHIRGEGKRFMLIAGGDYECSLALLPALWHAMATLLEGPFLVAMPARDLCFITTDSPEAFSGLRHQIDNLGELAYPISPAIYRVEKDGRWFEPVG